MTGIDVDKKPRLVSKPPYKDNRYSAPTPKDKGCRFADKFLGYRSKCSECPFVECFFGDSESRKWTGRRERQHERWQKVIKLSRQGNSVHQIARAVGLCKRQVHRILKVGRKDDQATIQCVQGSEAEMIHDRSKGRR